MISVKVRKREIGIRGNERGIGKRKISSERDRD